MLSAFTFILLKIMSKAVFVPIRAVNRFMETPRLSVTAKPLIGPVPNWKRTAAVISDFTDSFPFCVVG